MIENFEFEFDEDTGEVLNGDYLDKLEMDRHVKIENIALFIKSLKAESEMIKAEAKRLEERAKSKINKAAYLEQYLLNNLQGEKFESPRCKISYRKSESVEFLDENVFLKWASDRELNSLLNVKTEIKPNKTEIKKAIKNGGLKCPYVGLHKENKIQIK